MRERGVQGATDGILETQDTDCFRCGVAGFRGRGCGDSAEEKLGSGQGTGRAITRAKADVVSILLSEINQGAKSPSDVTEQVPQDAIVGCLATSGGEAETCTTQDSTTATERVEVGCRCVDLRSRANFRLYVVFPAMFEGLVESWILLLDRLQGIIGYEGLGG